MHNTVRTFSEEGWARGGRRGSSAASSAATATATSGSGPPLLHGCGALGSGANDRSTSKCTTRSRAASEEELRKGCLALQRVCTDTAVVDALLDLVELWAPADLVLGWMVQSAAGPGGTMAAVGRLARSCRRHHGPLRGICHLEQPGKAGLRDHCRAWAHLSTLGHLVPAAAGTPGPPRPPSAERLASV